MSKKRVIIVEDDTDLLDNLSEYFSSENLDVTGVSSAMDSFKALAESSYDVAVVDIGLPDLSGYEVVEYMRDKTSLGIVILTARPGIKDKMKGYDVGADHYFVKPANSSELVAVIKNLAARLDNNPHTSVIDEWQLDSQTWLLKSPDGITVNLTAKENAFLSLLLKQNGEPVSRENLRASLGYDFDVEHGNRALDVMVARLRKKLKEKLQIEAPLKTIHSLGYSFSAKENSLAM